MREFPFATLCGTDGQGRPVATQVPLFTDERDGHLILSGHIMKGTDHHQAFVAHPQALVLFTGPQAYVSASWYADPAQASTWNYLTVHARGPITFLDEGALIHLLQRTTDHFEGSPDSPASFAGLDPDYVNRLAKAIVAFEVKVEEMDHVFKLSQNRDEATIRNIISRLDEGDVDAKRIADAMRGLLS